MGVAKWGAMEGLAEGKISIGQYVLATATGLGSAGHLVESVASLSRRVRRTRPLEVE